MFNQNLGRIGRRFKEGSSWAAIAAAVYILGPEFVDDATWQKIVEAVAVVAAAFGFVLPDRGGNQN